MKFSFFDIKDFFNGCEFSTGQVSSKEMVACMIHAGTLLHSFGFSLVSWKGTMAQIMGVGGNRRQVASM